MIVKKGEKEIPGLTDEASAVPRRLGPKRASHIRKLFGLTKKDDVTANAIAKQFNNFDGTYAGAKDLIKYISRFLGQANAQGEQGLMNDLPQFYQNDSGIENMILAAAAIRSKNPYTAFYFYKRYGNQLGANINPDVVAKAIQAAQQNQTLGLEQAQRQVQQQQ